VIKLSLIVVNYLIKLVQEGIIKLTSGLKVTVKLLPDSWYCHLNCSTRMYDQNFLFIHRSFKEPFSCSIVVHWYWCSDNWNECV